MKTKLTSIIIASLAMPFAQIANAEEKTDHGSAHDEGKAHAEEDDDDHSAIKGPNGGHVVESKAGFSFEVTVDQDRKARVVFLDKNLKAVALEAQSITGIAGERSAPVKLIFAKGKDADANVLISDKALPAGAHVQMLLMVKATADAKASTERFELHLH